MPGREIIFSIENLELAMYSTWPSDIIGETKVWNPLVLLKFQQSNLFEWKPTRHAMDRIHFSYSKRKVENLMDRHSEKFLGARCPFDTFIDQRIMV